MIAIDLSKQQVLDADPKAIRKIYFTANLELDRNTTMFSIIKEAKRNDFRFLEGTVKVLWIYFTLI